MKDLMSLSGLGFEIVASICGMGLLGWALDKWTGLSPWLMAAGLVLGLVGGLYNAVKQALKIQKGGWSFTKGPLGNDRTKAGSDKTRVDHNHQEGGEAGD